MPSAFRQSDCTGITHGTIKDYFIESNLPRRIDTASYASYSSSYALLPLAHNSNPPWKVFVLFVVVCRLSKSCRLRAWQQTWVDVNTASRFCTWYIAPVADGWTLSVLNWPFWLTEALSSRWIYSDPFLLWLMNLAYTIRVVFHE